MLMYAEQPAPLVNRARQLLDELIQQRHLAAGQYALFFVSGEGNELPISRPGDEVEESSGYVLANDGRVYFFWFGWDAANQVPALTQWEEVTPEADWSQDEEYREARAQVGLSIGG
jgi:hypothetical protein